MRSEPKNKLFRPKEVFTVCDIKIELHEDAKMDKTSARGIQSVEFLKNHNQRSCFQGLERLQMS